MIYLDNAATTKMYDEALRVLTEANEKRWFNASALYKEASEESKTIRRARETLLGALKAGDGELYFLSGGTEADNTALFCTRKAKGSRVIVSEGEHDAVINPAKVLKEQGYDVVFAPIKSDGGVDEEKFAALLTPDVSLVSVMHVSNETGAVNDIAKLSAMTKRAAPKAVFHSDGVQAFGKIKVNLRSLGADLYTVSGHKIHGPKGIGALYVAKGAPVKPLVFGGGQEKGFRSGTENGPAIEAFAAAAERTMRNFEEDCSKKRRYLEYLREGLENRVPDVKIITDTERSAPHILTVAFGGVRGEVLLHALEERGILVGVGSACSSHRESRFKSLLGLDEAHRDGIVRFSVSAFNDFSEVATVVRETADAVARLKEYARK
ncbi:MAG TPA: cysteine desulfurase [Candidatus Limadaptatus stercorigallinarum]|uniref:Cysteine desulfurase n=1 Tax=Candidatus Limadaptatus stercorigallinarum TaxID=2840845 RepID=A0A9D1HUG6_9FIRM|nr:cysteine desulfurase [Candidatus Limadaptatus stercorigallinarum]